MRNLDMDLLRTFVAIAQHETFAAAAARVGRTQSAVTQQMQRLEDEMGCALFEKRGRHMWERLIALPNVKCVRPQGAFYCFPNIGAYIGKTAGGVKITDAVSFAAALLEQAHVAVVPGNDSGFETHVRLSFATSMAQIDKGLDRIGEFLKKLA